MRAALVGLAACAALAAPAAGGAQTTARVQAAFLTDIAPTLTLVYEYRTPLGGEAVAASSGPGPAVIQVRNWLFTAAAQAGVTFVDDGGDDVGPTLAGQVGVLRRLSGSLEPRVGLVAFGALRPEVAGPAARVELKHVFGAQLGWLWGNGDGVLASLDLSLALLEDLFR